MKTLKRLSPGLVIVLILGLLLSTGAVNVTQAAFAAVGRARPQAATMAVLPETTCTLAGTTRTCDLWAKVGTTTMPEFTYPVGHSLAGSSDIPIWSFVDAADAVPTLPGATLVVNQGETVVVNLNNTLGEPVSILLPGQVDVLAGTDPAAPETDVDGIVTSMVPAAPPGGSVQYSFIASQPGTYIYQSGTNGGRQVPMGLYGALIVRPTGFPLQAYADVSTTFAKEGLFVLSELDPFFNADPTMAVDQADPVFSLINGKPFPLSENVGADAGETVLLRYVNAGTQIHQMGVLGMTQTFLARDGQPWPRPIKAVVETLSPSQTVDALVTVPVDAQAGALYPIYHTNMLMQNNNKHDADLTHVVDFGGMLSFVEVGLGGPSTPVTGPLVNSVSVTPNKTNGSSGVTLAATVTGASSVEYYIDAYDGTPDGTGGSTLSVAIDTSAMASGEHTFYVRGTDGANWGPVSSAVLTLDKLGPASTGMVLVPPATNGLVSVQLRSTGDDRGLGSSEVVAAMYGIDSVPSIAMLRDQPPGATSVVAFKATIDAATIAALSEGLHDVRITSQDLVAAGENNWGAEGVIALTVDKTGPNTTSVVLNPSTLNFAGQPVAGTVRVTASVTDPVSAGVQTRVVAVEGFISTLGANGTGFKVFPSDGMWDEVTEEIYFDVPLVEFFRLSEGVHSVFIHGRDAAGNWGPAASGTVNVVHTQTGDLDGPVITNLTALPYRANANRPVTLTALATDAQSNIQGGEWFVGGDPGYGNGFALPARDGTFNNKTETLETVIDVSTWPNGQHQIMVRALDSANNWGPTSSVSVLVQGNNPNVIMMNGFELGATGFDGWTGTLGSAVTAEQAALGGSLKGMMNTLGGTTPSVAFLSLPIGETAINADFIIKPNGVNLMGGKTDIITGFNGGTPVFGITLGTPADAAKFDYEVSAWVNNSGVIDETEGFHIKSLEETTLGIAWTAGVDSTFTFFINGVAVAEIQSLDTSAFTLHEVWLGPSTNLNNSMSGAMYFDAFYLERQTKALNLIFMPIIH